MNPLTHNKAAVLPLLLAFALACLALSPRVLAVVPAPDGGYPNFNTAEGQNALFSLTTGVANTGVGWYSLWSNTDGSFNTAVGAGTLLFNVGDQIASEGVQNTAVGAGALLSNTTGVNNTGNGAFALLSNTTGNGNTATGVWALYLNSTGEANTASGAFALERNTEGSRNTAVGHGALASNTTGVDNTAIGPNALVNNTTGFRNIAVGREALYSNTVPAHNTAVGDAALRNASSGLNTALGAGAGFNLVSGAGNVYIGAGMNGIQEENNACYIASIFGQTSAGGTQVFINSNHKLGTMTSSKRFKEEIKPMDKVSEALFALKPVAFHYKKEIDPASTSQFGLVAEEVEKVNPHLVVRDKDGKPYSVRYDQVNAMLLNEFLKEHHRVEAQQRKIEKQEATITELKSTVAQQQRVFQSKLAEQEKQIEALTSGLQKVSTQLELDKRLGQAVAEN